MPEPAPADPEPSLISFQGAWDWSEMDAPSTLDAAWEELVADGCNASEVGYEWQVEVDDEEGADLFGLYMSDVSRFKLLCYEDELELAQMIEAGHAAARRLAQHRGELGDHEERRLRRLVRNGASARERFIASNLRLVVSIARRHGGLEMLDLIQHGTLGLMRAVDKYDYRLGYKFSTYASWWIRQAIQRAVADESRAIRLPVHRCERLWNLKAVRQRFEDDHGRVPRESEMAVLVECSNDEIRSLLRDEHQPSQLADDVDAVLNVNGELTYGIETKVSDRSVAGELRAILEELSPRRREVLKARFGFDDLRPKTLEEIGRRYGLTRERIRQIEAKALDILREPDYRARLSNMIDFPVRVPEAESDG